MAESHDVVIIGGGPGGYAAALYGAAAGLSIGMVERDRVGGTCLHRGCIPAKELLETAAVYRTVGHAGTFGIGSSEPTIDFGTTQARKQKVVDGLTKGLTGLLKARKVVTYEGTGTYTGSGNVHVEGSDGSATDLSADAVILASGSVVRTLPGFDIDGTWVLSSDEVLAMGDLPASAAVVGGGAIGCEFASMLADLGVQVTVLEYLPKILPGLDADVAAVVQRSFKRRDIDVRTGVKVTGHTPGKKTTTVHIEGGDDVEVERIVISVGRSPLSGSLGLDGTGVEVDDRGFVKVDATCRTTVDGVWAIGDLVATPQLAHVGFAEAIVAIKDILGEEPVPVQYDRVPWCIYCRPEVAFAGHSEESAKEAGYDVVVSKHQFRGNSRAQIIDDVEGLVKIIAAKDKDGKAGQILGVHMVGPWVTEQLGAGYLAVNWEASVDEVAAFIQPHPTLTELFGESVLALTGERTARLMPDITMPQLGETVTEGTITKWFKEVGDTVAEDEVLFEVSTDKVDSEVPSPAAGVLQEIKVPEGETVEVGAVIAVVGDGAAAPAADEAPAEQEAPVEPDETGSGEGGEPEAEEAPAAAQQVESPPEEPEVASAPAGGGDETAAAETASGPSAAPADETPEPAPAAGDRGAGASGRLLSPVVRRLIAEHDLDPAGIKGTGAGGRITRSDVLAVIEGGGGRRPAPADAEAEAAERTKELASEDAPAATGAPARPDAADVERERQEAAARGKAPQPAAARPAPAPAPAPTGRVEKVPFTNIRRRTAEHMVRSKATSAHTLMVIEVDYVAVDRARRPARAAFKEEEGVSLNYLPFVSRAVIDAIREYPRVNASVGEDELLVHHDVNLAIAVDLDLEGLVAPVVHGADGKRLRALAREIADLASRARERRLGPDDIAGGTFTITNPGPFGTLLTGAIINQPQVAILSTDGVKKRPVAIELPDGSDGIAVHPTGLLAINFDHRAIDGAYAAAFLAKVKEILETRDWEAEIG